MLPFISLILKNATLNVQLIHLNILLRINALVVENIAKYAAKILKEIVYFVTIELYWSKVNALILVLTDFGLAIILVFRKTDATGVVQSVKYVLKNAV